MYNEIEIEIKEDKYENKDADYVTSEDVVSLSAEKKKLKIFNDNNDSFLRRMINSSIKIVEQVINKKIIANIEKYEAHVEYINNLHGKVLLPHSPVLRVDKVIVGNEEVKDFSIMESYGKTFVLVPFIPSQHDYSTKIEIHYISGMRKNKLSDNIKMAASIVLQDLYDGKEFKNDNMLSLKMLLANEINYNL